MSNKCRLSENNDLSSFLARLKNRLNYDPESGIFTYKEKFYNMKKGQEAGFKRKDDDCVYIKFEQASYFAHHLAWLYMTGGFEKNILITHEDKNKSNNKFENLKKTNSVLCRSSLNPNKNNTSGFKGVLKSKKGEKWRAVFQSKKEKKFHHLGYFKTKEEAAKAYENFSIEYYSKFNV